MELKSSDKRFALLIDADNVSARYIKPILNELSKYGTVTIKRIYGDWTLTLHAKWKDALLENSITPIQQFGYTQGKNATDSAMIIDAMDILYTDSVDGFCIVSSDSDFTRLASRLRESGRTVIGMGEKKTPTPFRRACDVFTTLELLIDQKRGKGNGNDPSLSKDEVEQAVVDIITENQNNDKSTGLGEVGSRLLKRYPDFDVRSYGTNLLSKLLEEFTRVKITKSHSSVKVELAEAAEKPAETISGKQHEGEKRAQTADAADADSTTTVENGEDGESQLAKKPSRRRRARKPAQSNGTIEETSSEPAPETQPSAENDTPLSAPNAQSISDSTPHNTPGPDGANDEEHVAPIEDEPAVDHDSQTQDKPATKRRSRRARRKSAADSEENADHTAQPAKESPSDTRGHDEPDVVKDDAGAHAVLEAKQADADSEEDLASAGAKTPSEDKPKSRRRRRKSQTAIAENPASAGNAESHEEDSEEDLASAGAKTPSEDKPKSRRRRRKSQTAIAENPASAGNAESHEEEAAPDSRQMPDSSGVDAKSDPVDADPSSKKRDDAKKNAKRKPREDRRRNDADAPEQPTSDTDWEDASSANKTTRSASKNEPDDRRAKTNAGEPQSSTPQDLIYRIVEEAGTDGVPLAKLGRSVRSRFKDFKVRDLGFSQLRFYINSIPDFELVKNEKDLLVRLAK